MEQHRRQDRFVSQVRLNTMLQHAQPLVDERSAAAPTAKSALPAGRTRKELGLAVVLERARDRLRRARGGEVRP